MSDKDSYKSIFKATSLFGVVQVYNIFVSIVRSKFVALLIGPAGVGILGLYQSALDFVKQVTALGISQSGVRDVSEANGCGDFNKLSRTVTVVRRIVWITGLLGTLTVIALSPILSRLTFGNYDYTIPFIILSVTLTLDQLCAGQKVVLQGTRRLKDLAKASAIGSTISLFVTIPLYYLFGIRGIVPTFILNSVTTLIISWYYSRKIKIEKVQISYKETFATTKQMITMGIAMSVSGILSLGSAFILRGYIRSVGGIEEVGLFQAGFVIINTYVGLIFNAISTDYYPRLAAVNKDNMKCREIVSQQGEIATMILAPMLTVCLLYMPIMLRLLYSDKFLPANDFLIWSCVGMMFKLSSWLISFQFIAKAESKLFIINESTACVYSLLLSIIGYKLYGLTGLGIAFALKFIIYFIQVYIIANRRYGFMFSTDFIKGYSLQLLFVAGMLIVVLCFDNWYKYLIGSLIMLVSIVLALRSLNQRIDLLNYIKNRIFK